MSFLQTVVAFLVALAVLIVVHEYGHYLAARLFDVKVLRFSVGFGRAVFTRKRGRDATEWSIAAIPLGGYVKMLDEREGTVDPSERHRAFNTQSVWRRMVIVAAGPAFNFVFAILVYTVLNLVGVPESHPVLAAPPERSPAHVAGLREGDRVVAADGTRIESWQDLRWQLLRAGVRKTPVEIEFERAGGQRSSVMLDFGALDLDPADASGLERMGVRLSRPALPAVIGELIPGGPGALGGLLPGDEITRVDTTPIGSWEDFVAVVRAHPGLPLVLEVRRDGRVETLRVTPSAAGQGPRSIGRIEAKPRVPADFGRDTMFLQSHGPLDSVGRAVARTWELSTFTLQMIGKMLTGDVSWRHISGPVTIADVAGQSAQLGWIPYATFLALISISLGVLNLLPIPLLDGGHLMYYCFEVLKGSPVSERMLELGQRVGLTLLLVMMAFAFYNDINRLISG